MRIRHLLLLVFGALFAFEVLDMTFSFEGEVQDPSEIERISVKARFRAQAGNAMLVCAYSDQKCEGKMLEGALTRREFEEKLPSLFRRRNR